MTSKERHEARYQRRKILREKKRKQYSIPYDDFDKVFTYDNLFKSYQLCTKGVKWKASIQRFIIMSAVNTFRNFNRLHKGIFKHDNFYEFDLLERGKMRHIRSVSVRERGVQRCICDYCLVPLITRSFIYDNGASMKNKGYGFSRKRLVTHLHQYYNHYKDTDGYVLLFDFSKFFDNVNHQICFDIIDNKIKDEHLRITTKDFIEAFGDVGLGLGSQVSQIMALASANKLDHLIKEKLQIKYYGRYMDDGYLIHHDKEYLKYCLQEIQKICNELGIKLNIKKTVIVKLSHGFTFLKTRFYLLSNGKVVKKIYKKSIVKERRKLKKLRQKYDKSRVTMEDIYQSFQSWRAYAYTFDAYNAIQNMEKLYKQLFGNLESPKQKRTLMRPLYFFLQLVLQYTYAAYLDLLLTSALLY